MAILIEAIAQLGDVKFNTAFRENALYNMLLNIDGYKATRIDRVKSIKHVRECCGVDLKTAHDIVYRIFDGTL